MKNSEDFRRSVFEKAKRYEEKRKARRRKMIETASLCSLCIVIGLSAYLIGSGAGFDHNDLTTTSNSTLSTSATSTTVGTPHSNSGTAIETTTTTQVTTTAVTTTTTLSTTTIATTTIWATSTTTDMTVSATSTTETTSADSFTEGAETTALSPAPMTLISSDVPATEITPEAIYFCKKDYLPASADIYVIRDSTTLEQAIFHDVYDDRLTDEDKLTLCKRYGSDFFEENILLMVYAPAKWTAYGVKYRNGGVTAFFDIEMEEDRGVEYELHTYILPRNDEEARTAYLLTYEETP